MSLEEFNELPEDQAAARLDTCLDNPSKCGCGDNPDIECGVR